MGRRTPRAEAQKVARLIRAVQAAADRLSERDALTMITVSLVRAKDRRLRAVDIAILAVALARGDVSAANQLLGFMTMLAPKRRKRSAPAVSKVVSLADERSKRRQKAKAPDA